MKKVMIFMCGVAVVGCALASDGEPGRACYHTEADQRRRSLNAEFARKRAEAREAAARARTAEVEAQRIKAAKNPKGLLIKIPQTTCSVPMMPPAMAVAAALVYSGSNRRF